MSASGKMTCDMATVSSRALDPTSVTMKGNGKMDCATVAQSLDGTLETLLPAFLRKEKWLDQDSCANHQLLQTIGRVQLYLCRVIQFIQPGTALEQAHCGRDRFIPRRCFYFQQARYIPRHANTPLHNQKIKAKGFVSVILIANNNNHCLRKVTFEAAASQ